jgi:hypothetical protein
MSATSSQASVVLVANVRIHSPDAGSSVQSPLSPAADIRRIGAGQQCADCVAKVAKQAL